jgi:hypothetical protein
MWLLLRIALRLSIALYLRRSIDWRLVMLLLLLQLLRWPWLRHRYRTLHHRWTSGGCSSSLPLSRRRELDSELHVSMRLSILALHGHSDQRSLTLRRGGGRSSSLVQDASQFDRIGAHRVRSIKHLHVHQRVRR